MWRSFEARYENFESIRRPVFSRLAPTPLRPYRLQHAFVFPDKHSSDTNRKDRDCQQCNCKKLRNIPKFRIFSYWPSLYQPRKTLYKKCSALDRTGTQASEPCNVTQRFKTSKGGYIVDFYSPLWFVLLQVQYRKCFRSAP